MDASDRQTVWDLANSECEYCQLPQAVDPLPFQIDHIIAVQHGGLTALENLALSCLHCNKHKGPNIAGLDPQSGVLVRLFHPRTDRWADHFRWNGSRMEGLTEVGRATVLVLDMNDPILVAFREALIGEGYFAARSVKHQAGQRP